MRREGEDMMDEVIWVGPSDSIEVRRKSRRISRIGRKEPDPDLEPDPAATDRLKELVMKFRTLRSSPYLPAGLGDLIDEILDTLESSIPDRSAGHAGGVGAVKSAWNVADSEFHDPPVPRSANRGLRNFAVAQKAMPRIFRELELMRLEGTVHELEVHQKALRQDLERPRRELEQAWFDQLARLTAKRRTYD
jgi:hypothetical protein